MTVDSVEVVFRGRCSHSAEQGATVGGSRRGQDPHHGWTPDRRFVGRGCIRLSKITLRLWSSPP